MNSIRMHLVLGLLAVAGLVGIGAGAFLLSSTEQRLRVQLRDQLLAELRLGAEDIVLELFAQGREGRPAPFTPGPRKASPFGPLAKRSEHHFVATSGERRIASDELTGVELPSGGFPLVPVEFEQLDAENVRFGPVALPGFEEEFLRLEAAFYPPLRFPQALTERPALSRAAGRVAERRRRPVRVSILADGSALRETRRALATSLFWTGSLTAALSLTLILWVVTRSLRPLGSLRTQLDGLDADSLERRVELPEAPSELRPVVDEINSLLQRLKAAFEREQAFLGDAAHELRTPIAGLRATLELSRSRPRSNEEYRRSTDDCLALTLNMQRLVEGLFELAQPAATEQALSLENLSPKDELKAVLKSMSPAQDRSVELTWSECGQCGVIADRVLLRAILSNLLDNALCHGCAHPDTGVVSVQVSLQCNGQRVRLTLSNDSQGLARGDAEHVFEPFWRANAARTQGRHAGIGLSLCRRAAEALGAQLSVQIDSNCFRVELELPAAPIRKDSPPSPCSLPGAGESPAPG